MSSATLRLIGCLVLVTTLVVLTVLRVARRPPHENAIPPLPAHLTSP